MKKNIIADITSIPKSDSRHTVPNNTSLRVYTMREVGAMLGLSKCTVYKLARQGVFPVIKLGKQYLSPKVAFDKWLETLEFDGDFSISGGENQ